MVLDSWILCGRKMAITSISSAAWALVANDGNQGRVQIGHAAQVDRDEPVAARGYCSDETHLVWCALIGTLHVVDCTAQGCI